MQSEARGDRGVDAGAEPGVGTVPGDRNGVTFGQCLVRFGVVEQLEPGGCLLIEVHIPELRKLPPGQNLVPFHVSPTRAAFDVYDTAAQAMSSNYFKIIDGRGEFTTYPFRYAWPAQLDLMAQLAGLELRERWSGWAREPFTSESSKHISVWTKPVLP